MLLLNNFLKIFLASLCLSGIVSGCKKNDPKEVESITSRTKPAEVSTGVTALYSDSAKLKAKLITPKMVRLINDSPTVEMPKGLEVWFYDNKGKVNSHLRSNYGIRFINKALTRVSGNVQVVNLKGDSLNTEEMFWDEPKAKIYSNKFVKVRTKDEIIFADGFESDVNFSNYTFYKIKGRLSVKQ